MNNIGLISNIFDGLLGKLRPVSAVILVGIVGFSFLPASVTRSDATKSTTTQTSPADKAMPNLQGDEAVEHLKQAGTYDSLQEAMGAIKYEARWQEKPQLSGVGGSYEFKNAANDLLAYVTTDGIEATSLSARQRPWRLGLKLKDFGYGKELSLVTPGEVNAKNNRVSIQRSAIRNPQSRSGS
ncbi:MAG: hypothetical protein AABO41_27900 [Acidobacteriota bacterium]